MIWDGLAIMALVQMAIINAVVLGIGAMIIKDALTPKKEVAADALPA